MALRGFVNDLERLRRAALEHFGERFFLRAELDLPPLVHREDQIEAGDGARPMRDHHDNSFACPHPDNGARERLVAFGVEVRVGLIEHDQKRVAVERARERNALRLAGGQRRALFADPGPVALGHADDQVVHARGLRRRDDGLRRRIRRKARNVLGDRSGQKLDVLRQIADMLAERFG